MHIFKWVNTMKNFKLLLFLLFIGSFAILLITNSTLCKGAVINALFLCGNVIIPSLFPFCFCVLCILNSGIFNRFHSSSPYIMGIALLSFIGGYPIGASLLNECVKSGILTPSNGRKMLGFCVNAGPAFVISAVGEAMLKSRDLGSLLFAAHLLSSVTIMLLSGKIEISPHPQISTTSFTDNFTLSAVKSAQSVMNICTFILLFAPITAFLNTCCKPLAFLSEVTLGVSRAKNIYLISFLLGFGGLCIWCQILAVAKALNIKLSTFALSRICHGLLSVGFTYLLLKIFPAAAATFSNIDKFTKKYSFSGESVSISLVIMCIVFIISLTAKREKIKILEEII